MSARPFPIIAILLCTVAIIGIILAYLAAWASPPYAPTQPVPFSHRTHAKKLGINCLACHTESMRNARAGVPDAISCLACHKHTLADDPRLRPVRESADPDFRGYTGKPIEWVRVQTLPAYVRFDHSAHVSRGVSCTACHGNTATQNITKAAPALHMRDCMACHQAPHGIRPLEHVSNPNYNDAAAESIRLSDELIRLRKITPSLNCTVCHH